MQDTVLFSYEIRHPQLNRYLGVLFSHSSCNVSQCFSPFIPTDIYSSLVGKVLQELLLNFLFLLIITGWLSLICQVCLFEDFVLPITII